MTTRICRTDNYNWNFDSNNGMFMRWGKSIEDDPSFSPIGCEIADIEITTVCHGVAGKVCSYCYKSNTPNGKNMSIDTFSKILKKMPRNLTQIAFGVDAACTANPDVWKIMDLCRENNIVPNVTVADIDDEVADKLAKVCGAVAVTQHGNKDVCYSSIKKLTDRGLKQTNMHIVLSAETYDLVVDTMKDITIDERLKDLNAVVFLSLKQKGRGKDHNKMSTDQFKSIIELAFENSINFGFDSCTAAKFTEVLKDIKSESEFKEMLPMIESCESGCFSIYINVDGEVIPCSFTEGTSGWEKGISLLDDNVDFINDIWYGERISKFRKDLLLGQNKDGMRCCPIFEV